VLRKITRRAIRHCEITWGFVAGPRGDGDGGAAVNGAAYPEIGGANGARIRTIVLSEETRFANTLDLGLKRLEEEIAPLRVFVGTSSSKANAYQGENAFRLYDTFGLPGIL